MAAEQDKPDPSKPSWFGSLKGQIWIAPGSEKPDEELTREMEDGPIYPPDDET
ncbi:MAG TPA: hypothetical protein VHS81_10955 [Caulobacteraceae bacterium]|nr:hypothetical protein [Caulobacteraceae bacterium]